MFLRGAAASAAAAPLVPGAIGGGMLNSAALGNALAARELGSVENVWLPHSGDDFSPANVLLAAARKAYHRHRRERRQRALYRIGPFEPSIACLHSVSYAAKVAYQREADTTGRSTVLGLLRAAYPTMNEEDEN